MAYPLWAVFSLGLVFCSYLTAVYPTVRCGTVEVGGRVTGCTGTEWQLQPFVVAVPCLACFHQDGQLRIV